MDYLKIVVKLLKLLTYSEYTLDGNINHISKSCFSYFSTFKYI